MPIRKKAKIKKKTKLALKKKINKKRGSLASKKTRPVKSRGAGISAEQKLFNGVKNQKIHPVKYREAVISPSAKLFNRAGTAKVFSFEKERRALLCDIKNVNTVQEKPIYKINLRDETDNKILAYFVNRLPKLKGEQALLCDIPALVAPVKEPQNLDTQLLNQTAEMPPPPKKIFTKPVLFSVFAGLVLAGVFTSVLYVFAIPPTSKYDFGETLDPNCSPDPASPNYKLNCTVVAPAQYLFTTNNFSGTGDFTTTGTITAGTLKVGTVYTFPTSDGTVGQVLSTNGSGTVSWAAAGSGSPGGANTQVQYNSSGAFAGSANMTFDGSILTVANLKDSGLTSGRVTYAAASGQLTDSGAFTFASGNLTLGAVASSTGKLSIKGTTSGTVDVKTADAAGTWTLTLPTTGGTNGYFLQTNGAGVTTWAAALTSVTAHNLLSATHGDTTTAAAVRGDLITGQGVSPTWTRLAKGATGTILTTDANDVVWSTATYPATTTINQVLYSSAANVVSGLATANYGVLNTGATGIPSITATPTISTSLTIGVAGTATGQLNMAGTTSGVVSVKTADAAGTWTLTLPTTGGTNGYFLQTNGAGVTTWAAALTSVTAHNLLSATHGDTTTAAAVRGDLITGQGVSPTWTRLAKGATGTILTTDANDVVWSTATYPATATGTGTILRADGNNWVATTATYPATTTINQLLYSSNNSVVSGLATANYGVLNTGATGIPSITATPTISTSLTIGVAGTATGQLNMAGTTSGVVSVKTADAAGTWTLTLPTTGGTNGYFLQTNGAGVTTWAAALTSVTAHNLLSATHGDTTTAAAVRGDLITGQGVSPTWTRLAKGATGTILTTDANDVVWSTATYPATTTINQVLYSSAANVVSGLATANYGVLNTGATGIPSITATPTISTSLTIGVAGTATGQLNMAGTTSGVVSVKTADAAGTWTLTLPTTGGTNGYFLQTNGAGVTTWAAALTSVTAHNLLSATHGDTTTAAAVRGDLITGQGVSPTWTRLAKGATGTILTTDANDVVWSTATYPATATGTGTILRADGNNWVATTATYPATTTINQLLYSSNNSVVSGLATANYGVLNTGATGIPSITATPTISTSLTIGVAGTATGQLNMAGTTSGVVSVKTADAAGTWTLTLPTTGGTNGYFLQTNGAGVTTWAAALTSVTAHNLLSATHGDTTTAAAVRGDLITGQGVSPTWTRLAKGATGTILTTDANDVVWSTATYPATTTINQVLYSSAANVVSGLATANYGVLNTGATGIPSITATPTISTSLTIGVAGTATGQLNMAGTTSGVVSVKTADAAGTWTLTLPTTGGTNGYFLQTNGAGVTTWAAALTSVTAHNLLSATHGDTTTAAAVRGDLITGQGVSPTWTRLAKGATGTILTTDANDVVWSTATYPATATGTGTILRADGNNWVATTATYPATTTINQLLYSSNNSVVSGLATANYGVLNTGATGIPSITATPTISTSLTIGVAGTATGQLNMAGTTSGVVSVKTADAAGTWTLTLPTTGGTNGYFLQTNGAGVTTWAAALTSVTAHNLLSATHGDTTTAAAVRGDLITGQGVSPTWTRLAKGATGTILTTDANDVVWSTATYPATTTINQVLYSSAANVVSGLATANYGVLNTGATGIPSITATPTISTSLTIGVAGTATGQLNMAGTTSGVVSVKTADAAGTWTLTLPTTGGTNGYFLQTNGAGVTTWAAALTSVTAHNLLSATHGDTTTAAAVRGDLITGQGVSPTWTRLAKGATGTILTTDANDVVWSTATYPATATGTGTILRADGNNWVATTATYPATTTINQLLYSSNNSVVSGLATANYGVLNTGATGIPSITATPTISTSLTIGVAGTATGQLNMAGTTSGVVSVKTADAAGTWTLTLPTTGGTNGYFLQTNGAGVTTWAAASGTSLWYQPTTPGGNMLSNGTGAVAGNLTMTGTNNFLAGNQAGLALTEGISNNFIGYQSGYSDTTGSGNTAYGHQAGYTNITGSYDVFLGYQAGYYETGSNKLFIDNTKRTNEADARLKALVYGVFNAATTSQILAVNAKLGIIDSGSDHYSYLQGGNQSADLTYTLPTGYPAVTGYVLSSTTAGVMSWAAQTTGTVTGSGTSPQVAYWNGNTSLTGSANMTFDGSILTVANLKDSGLTSGRVTYATTSGQLTDSANFTYSGTLLTVSGTGNGGYINITDEANGYKIDGLRVLSYKGSTGSENLFLGQSGNFTLTGTSNITAGYQAGLALTTGINNNFVGYQSGYSNTTGGSNDFFGYQAGYTNISGSNDVFLGNQAGYWETGSNKLFIDNQQRASEADARTKALIYGVFDAAVANQTLTVNGNTDFSPGLTTLNYSTSAPTLATNGQLAVAYVGAAARLYFRANGTTYYIDKNGGFGIPAPETVDPVSGDKMKIGDFVVGMINQNLGDEDTPENSSLHGIWVKWDSLKEELIKEIRASGDIAPAGGWAESAQISNSESDEIKGVDTTTMLDKVTNILSSLGISIKDGVTHITELAVKKSTTETARIQKLEMVDEATGEIYCTWIENGNWQKAKGDCASIKANQTVVQTQQPQASTEEIKQEVKEELKPEVKQEVKQELKPEIKKQVESQVGAEVQQQLQEQQSSEIQLTIVSIASINDITIAFGTALSDANLPTTVSATMSDNSTQGLTVSWDNGIPDYDANIADTYVFLGTPNNLPAGVTNPDNITTNVNVIVQPVPAPEGQQPEEQAPAEEQSQEQQQSQEQETPPQEVLPTEQPSELIPPVGELIQDAASSLLNGMLEFVKWLFNIGVQKIASLDIIKKMSDGLTQEIQGLNKSVKISLEKTTPDLIKAQTASVLEPLQNFWSSIIENIHR